MTKEPLLARNRPTEWHSSLFQPLSFREPPTPGLGTARASLTIDSSVAQQRRPGPQQTQIKLDLGPNSGELNCLDDPGARKDDQTFKSIHFDACWILCRLGNWAPVLLNGQLWSYIIATEVGHVHSQLLQWQWK